MGSECLPFTQIPHSTRLFSDFLYNHPRVQQFYARVPDLKQWAENEAGQIGYDDARRQRVAVILERQNQSWGAGPETKTNLARFRKGAACVVTGQQVGLFGGPLFAIFKALSAVRMSAEATASGVDCVPIFWLATEDHDLAEVNHTDLLGPEGTLHSLKTSSHDVLDAPLNKIPLASDIRELVAQAAEVLGESEITEILRQAYRPGVTLGDAFARLFTNLLSRWGVIMLDAADPELHTLARPIYSAAAEHAVALDDALLRRGQELTKAGYHEQVKVTPLSTLLFTVRNGARVVIHRGGGVTSGANGNGFRVGQEKISSAELLKRIAERPQDFSANVLLRPVVQDFLLPTLAYVAGPAEIAYFAQAAVVYEKLLQRITPVLPRFSATLVEPKPRELMERYRVGLRDLLHGLEEVQQLLATRVLPPELQAAFDSAEKTLERSVNTIREALRKLDPTLVDAAQRAASKMNYQLEQLRARAARAELRRKEILARHALQLSNSLYPRKELQEREIGGVSFLGRHGLELLERLYAATGAACPDHQIIYL